MIGGWVDLLRRQSAAFKVNILRNLAQRFANNLTTQYQPLYLTSLGASTILLGYLSSATGLVNTLISIPIGAAADRWGIKRVLLAYTALATLSAVIFAFSGSWETAAVAFVLTSSVMIMDRTVCPMICGSIPSAERVRAMGVCDTISFLPQLVAPLAGAYLISVFGGINAAGIRPLFYIQIAFLLVAAGVLYFFFRDPERPAGVRKGSFTEDLSSILREGRYTKRWILAAVTAALPLQLGFYTPLYAAQVRHADPFIIGGISAASTCVFVFLAIPLAQLSDTIGRKKIAMLCAGLTSLGYVVLVFAPDNLWLLLAGFLSGFTMSLTQNMMAISADLVPPQKLGSWIGIQSFSRGIVSVVSPVVCGYLWSYVYPQSVFYLLTATQLLVAAQLFLIPSEVTR